MVDRTSNDLKVIDVSDPSTPNLVETLGVGDFPLSVYVIGRYAYVADGASDDLKVIDVSDPSAPSLAGSLDIGGNPSSVHVSGRYAYVVDRASNDLKVIDVSGAEVTSLVAHSLEAGNLQVRDDMIAQGQLQVTGGLNVGAGGIFSDGDVGVGGDVTITGDLTISGSCSGCASDRDLKQNIQPLDNALDRISQMRGVAYDWRNDVREAKYYPGPQIGVLGQDVEAVFPELVGTDSRGYKFVRYQKLVAPLIEAVKELAAQKDAEIAQLKTENEAIKQILRLDYPQAELCR